MSKSIALPMNEIRAPKLSLFLSMLQETRLILLRDIEGITQEVLDYSSDDTKVETIGTLLIHIAAIEWSWIFEDIDGLEMSFEKWKYAFPLREGVDLSQLKNQPLDYYLSILEETRKEATERISKFNDEDLFNKIRSGDTEFTIEWILYHIIEHELTHIGQIRLLKKLASN
jgi:uncharacterized damage-inducible protein DinB